jgi:uracil-DNA glycosylase family protein
MRTSSPIGASRFLPQSRSLRALRDAVQGCRGCDLYRKATQAVFGRGAARASVVLVGEQPGDREDRAGLPFVGPAGRVLDDALADAGLARDEVYVTNAVKHFKFEERGKRRIHKKPRASETNACYPWLAAELAAIRPRVVVALGATARDSLARESRAQAPVARAGPNVISTLHPSAVLRAPDHASRSRLYARLVQDLRKARVAARGA